MIRTDTQTETTRTITRTYDREPERRTGKCRKCKRARSGLFVAERTAESFTLAPQKRILGGGGHWRITDSGEVFPVSPSYCQPVFSCCDREWPMATVRGRYNLKKVCNARCESATGHSCECSCGGRNHGAAHG